MEGLKKKGRVIFYDAKDVSWKKKENFRQKDGDLIMSVNEELIF